MAPKSEAKKSAAEFALLMRQAQENFKDKTLGELCKMAEDASLPASTLEVLARYPSAEVREAISDNPNLPYSSLHQLVNDECDDVRYAIAENHNMPLSILDELSADDNPYVSSRAIQTLARLRTCYGFGNKLDDLERTIQIKHTRLQGCG